MNSNKMFKKFLMDLHSKFPEHFPQTKISETEIEDFHRIFIQQSLEIFKRDPVLWETPKLLFGYDLSELWKNSDSHSIIWDNLQACLLSSMFHGKFEAKLEGNMPLISTLLKSFIGENSEIDSILNDDSKKSAISDFFEFLKETKLAALILSVFGKIDVSKLDVNVTSFEEIQGKLETMQTDPAMLKIQSELKGILEDKAKSGEFSKEIVTQEIQKIKLKVQELFGDAFNDILGTRKAEVPAELITSNTPEARRARMLARLQRKLKAKK